MRYSDDRVTNVEKAVHYGTGRHILLLDLEQVIAFTKASRLFSSKYPSFKNPRNPYPNDVSVGVLGPGSIPAFSKRSIHLD